MRSLVPTARKKTPPDNLVTPDIPDEYLASVETPTESPPIEETPEISPPKEETPEATQKLETVPDPSPEKQEMPSDLNEENCVEIDGKKYEIKPTKLKYFRNHGASGYGIIKAVSPHELLTYDKGQIPGEKRSADQLVYDFLVAAFDDSAFVRDHYDEIDADQLDRIVKIFGRINHIDEKEEQARKNREARVNH